MGKSHKKVGRVGSHKQDDEVIARNTHLEKGMPFILETEMARVGLL